MKYPKAIKIKGAMSLYLGQDSVRFELEDVTSGIRFISAEIPALDFQKMLSRQSCVKIDAEVFCLDRVGMKQEYKQLAVECLEDMPWDGRNDLCKKLIADNIPKGWVSDDYFGSQSTFFQKNGKHYVQTTIRRWVKNDSVPI